MLTVINMNNQKHVSLLVIGVLVGAVFYIAEIAEPSAVAVYGQNTENFTSNFSNYNTILLNLTKVAELLNLTKVAELLNLTKVAELLRL